MAKEQAITFSNGFISLIIVAVLTIKGAFNHEFTLCVYQCLATPLKPLTA